MNSSRKVHLIYHTQQPSKRLGTTQRHSGDIEHVQCIAQLPFHALLLLSGFSYSHLDSFKHGVHGGLASFWIMEGIIDTTHASLHTSSTLSFACIRQVFPGDKIELATTQALCTTY